MTSWLPRLTAVNGGLGTRCTFFRAVRPLRGRCPRLLASL